MKLPLFSLSRASIKIAVSGFSFGRRQRRAHIPPLSRKWLLDRADNACWKKVYNHSVIAFHICFNKCLRGIRTGTQLRSPYLLERWRPCLGRGKVHRFFLFSILSSFDQQRPLLVAWFEPARGCVVCFWIGMSLDSGSDLSSFVGFGRRERADQSPSRHRMPEATVNMNAI